MQKKKCLKTFLIGFVIIITTTYSVSITCTNRPNESEDYPRVTFVDIV